LFVRNICYTVMFVMFIPIYIFKQTLLYLNVNFYDKNWQKTVSAETV